MMGRVLSITFALFFVCFLDEVLCQVLYEDGKVNFNDIFDWTKIAFTQNSPFVQTLTCMPSKKGLDVARVSTRPKAIAVALSWNTSVIAAYLKVLPVRTDRVARIVSSQSISLTFFKFWCFFSQIALLRMGLCSCVSTVVISKQRFQMAFINLTRLLILALTDHFLVISQATSICRNCGRVQFLKRVRWKVHVQLDRLVRVPVLEQPRSLPKGTERPDLSKRVAEFLVIGNYCWRSCSVFSEAFFHCCNFAFFAKLFPEIFGFPTEKTVDAALGIKKI